MINTSKVYRRTVQTFFNRRHPYYAHLCVTQRCNLRCRYCRIWEDPPDELTTEQWKQAIAKFDKMGVACLIFTGGEPLLRQDIFELIDCAAATGLVTAITSNGVNSSQMYGDLLKTNIHKLTISLDGVEGDDVPYSHTGRKILDNIEFINANKKDKIFTVSTVLFDGNRDSVTAVVKYCEARAIKVFVQPVITGSSISPLAIHTKAGTLRREGTKVAPVAVESPSVLNPAFFNDAAAEYAKEGRLPWNCLGGQLFFDVKPNGEFWICQDYPTTLNITDPDFDDKWKAYDFDHARKQCTNGCIYSCYYLTQKGFELKHIPAMLKMARNYL